MGLRVAPNRHRVARLAILLLVLPAQSARPHSPRHGADAMSEPHATSLLVDYYEAFLRDQDLNAFVLSVSARYNEGTLARLLRNGPSQGRRAAVLALGLTGTFQANDAVGRSLRDPDAVVRSLAQNALWAIWFRADSPENNATLQEIADLIGRGRSDEAGRLANRLIARAPDFAEAYNQRAIALFEQERFAESAEDCRRAIERNPYHTGALGGLAQCYLRLDDRDAALKVYRRALKVQPYNDAIRRAMMALEAQGE